MGKSGRGRGRFKGWVKRDSDVASLFRAVFSTMRKNPGSNNKKEAMQVWFGQLD